MTRGADTKVKPSEKTFLETIKLLSRNPIFSKLVGRLNWVHNDTRYCPENAWLIAGHDEYVWLNSKRLALPEHWVYVMARTLLIYAMELWQKDHGDWAAWSAACDVVTARFLHGLKFASAPPEMDFPSGLPLWDELRWYRQFSSAGIPDWARRLSLGGPYRPTMNDSFVEAHRLSASYSGPWSEAFATGIAESARIALQVASGARPNMHELGTKKDELSIEARQARDWFISSFPLLGSMVAAFDFVEDTQLCRQENISIAAVDEISRVIYLNPAQRLSTAELRFVIAHEVLHVALRHGSRAQGRDHFLWNAACDFVVNSWLIELQVGAAPAIGLLYDKDLHGLSAEEVYDQIVKDLRIKRKLSTFAGKQPDVLARRIGEERKLFSDLDEFCRDHLGRGLLMHQQSGRGLLPAGLLEEINAVLQPPIPWEVRLARWFDHHFPPVDTVRTWSRLSRRQSATPEIPRPRLAPNPNNLVGRTFGVILDTSGSMSNKALGRALGSIASYAEAKEVQAVRVVCCDARPYDLGWLPAGEIADRVTLRGRGGTVLQPGIDLLETDHDFPKDGPLLVITDGDCDRLVISREHAFLLPEGRRLPFPARGEIFEMSS